ncbi:MAG: phosphoribosylformylglycinamidine synthase subunit PurS [Pyrodictiaceae archaeon]
MPRHRVLLVVTNKASARDPEGETLAHELRLQGYRYVLGMRAGKAYIIDVDAASEDEAIKLVEDLARRARLYNPVVHSIQVLRLG